MVALVERYVDSNLEEPVDADDIAPIEDPTKVSWLVIVFCKLYVQRRRKDQNCHVDGEEMGFEKAMHHIEDALPVRLFNSILVNVGKDTILNMRLTTLLVDYESFGNSDIVGGRKCIVKRLIGAMSLLSILPQLDKFA